MGSFREPRSGPQVRACGQDGPAGQSSGMMWVRPAGPMLASSDAQGRSIETALSTRDKLDDGS